MPRDVEPNAVPTVKDDLKTLVGILRNEPHPNWNFSHTATCALGIVRNRFSADRYMRLGETVDFRSFGKIFGAGSGTFDAHRITPAVVAGRIEDYLAGRPIRRIEPVPD